MVSLLAPICLAEADPELFDAAGFKIDERIHSEDHPEIRKVMSHTLGKQKKGTRLFFADDDMMGTGYPGVKEGNLVCIIYGSPVPRILRQLDEDGHFTLIGASNADGLMFGEGLETGLLEQDFILV